MRARHEDERFEALVAAARGRGLSKSSSASPAALSSRSTTPCTTQEAAPRPRAPRAGRGHMADGYARATGKVGVCIATSGPGATNLVTASPTPTWTRSRGGHHRPGASDLIGTDAFQEADITGITLPIVKHSYLVKDARTCRGSSHEAFYIAAHRPARPGAHRHPDRRGARRGRPTTAGRRSTARLQAHAQGPHKQIERGRRGDRRGRAAGALRWAAA